MDMSKLPRLSNSRNETPPPEDALPPPEQPIPAQAHYNPRETPMTQGQLLGAEVWLSAILGIIFMLMGRNFAVWALTKLFGGTYHTQVNWTSGPLAGQEVAYPELVGFVMLTDASIFVFGLALLFEAIVLFASSTSKGLRRPLLMLAFGITVLAIAFNLFACAKLMANNITPLISLLGTAFAVYIAIYQWALLKPPRRAA